VGTGAGVAAVDRKTPILRAKGSTEIPWMRIVNSTTPKVMVRIKE
jgi:hypothetical protein